MVTYQGFWSEGLVGSPNNMNAGLFQFDTFANRPAAGLAGIFFVASDTFDVYRDNGATWDLIGRLISTGAQTWNGVKTFGSIPVGPASNPTTANQLARKQYVDTFGISDVQHGVRATANGHGHSQLSGLTTGDDHTQYQKESEKGVVNGYASLDASGDVPDAQIAASIARDSELHAQAHTHTVGLADISTQRLSGSTAVAANTDTFVASQTP